MEAAVFHLKDQLGVHGWILRRQR